MYSLGHHSRTTTSVSVSSTKVVALCLVCFILGRWSVTPDLPQAGRGLVVTRYNSTSDQKASTRHEVRGTSRGGSSARRFGSSLKGEQERLSTDGKLFADHDAQSLDGMTFEQVIEQSGILSGYEPLKEHGASGHPFYTVQPMQLLSWYPRAYLFPKFISRAMCDHVIKLAESRLAPSGLALKKGDTLSSTREIRTSQGTFLSRGHDPDGILAYIEDKIAVVTGIPAGHGESFNVLKYEHGQHYDSHYDSFDEGSYGKQFSQRIATVLVYLSDVEEGGETSFLFEGVNGTQRIKTVDYKKCDTGIKYKPRAGDALLFWSIHPDMSSDKHSLHGGCPVVKGTKWTATKWIRDKCTVSPGGVPCSSPNVP